MIERTYSAHIGHYADEIARRGLLAPAPTRARGAKHAILTKPPRKVSSEAVISPTHTFGGQGVAEAEAYIKTRLA